jgi:uncharacterized membrane protein YhaH (DUF805 family)
MPGIEPKAGPCDQYSGPPAVAGLPEAAMDYRRFLYHFEGRINRARYLLALLIILGSMVFALLSLAIISAFFGIATGPLSINLVGVAASFDLDADTAVKVALFPQIVTIPMTLVFAWFYAAASIKRLHDRNKSGWWMIPFVAATGLYGQFGGWLGGAAFFVGLAVFIAFIWGLVEMYFLKGTNGPNRFGPDPLPKAQTRSRSSQTGLRMSSAWDQHSEIEFVPHSAGPSPGPHVKRGHD